MGFLHPENSTGVIDAPSSLSTFTFVQKVSEKKKKTNGRTENPLPGGVPFLYHYPLRTPSTVSETS